MGGRNQMGADLDIIPSNVFETSVEYHRYTKPNTKDKLIERNPGGDEHLHSGVAWLYLHTCDKASNRIPWAGP